MRTFEGPFARTRVQSLAFLPDGMGLVAGGNTGIIRLWDVASGQPRWERSKGISIRDLVVTPDGGTIVAAGGYYGLEFSTTANGDELYPLYRFSQMHVRRIALDASGQRLATAPTAAADPRQSRLVEVWDPIQRSGLNKLAILGGAWSAAFRPGHAEVAIGTAREGVVIWELDRHLRSGAFPPAGPSTLGGLEEGFEEVGGFRRLPTDHNARHVRYAPDGRTLVVAVDRSVHAHDADGGRRTATFDGHEAPIEAIDLSPDGTTLASASHDGTVRLWDLATGQPTACYDWDLGPVECVRFAPDGMTLAAGGRCGIVLWDVEAP